VEEKDGRTFVHLWKGVKKQLITQGIPEMNIEVYPYCTACNPQIFYSWRMAGKLGGLEGEMLSVIGINPTPIFKSGGELIKHNKAIAEL